MKMGRPKLWTLERCQVEALKYPNRKAFQLGNYAAYRSAHRYGWLDAICGHMVPQMAPRGTWTKERCQVEALKFTTRDKFARGGSAGYTTAKQRRWLNEICAHMVSGGAGFDTTRPATLYYYRVGDLFKLGITNRTVRLRVGAKQFATITVLAEKHFPIGADAVKAELAIKSFVDAGHRYDGPPVLVYGGDTELFTCDILGLAA